MIVADLGCYPHEGEQSVPTLLERYDPDVLYGFDPDLTHPVSDDVRCIFIAAAAWTHDGHVALGHGGPNGLYDTIEPSYANEKAWSRTRTVACLDFARWLLANPFPTVVKMNIEGAEYALMEHILANGADRNVTEWLIAWHDEHMPDSYSDRHVRILARVHAPVKPWTINDVTLCA